MQKIFLMLCIILTTCTTQTLPPYLTSKSPWAEKTIKTLTLRQKIGQLFIVATTSNFNQPSEALASALAASPYTMDHAHIKKMIKEYNVGGIIFLYKSDPATQIALTKKFQEITKTPLLIAQDCEWGLAMRLDNDPTKVVRYPHNMTLGALPDEKLVYDIGNEIGRQCGVIGVHMNFAPVADVNNNSENPVIHDRSFGDNPEHVAQLAILFARGLQDAGVIACAKHFPGHGDTTVDSHFDLPVINHDKKRLNEIELLPFKKLIDEGVGAVMNAHLAVPELDPTPNQPSSMSYAIVTEQLKNNLGFKGLVITDALGMEAITKQYKPGELELQAFLAGNEILLCPLDVPRAVELIEQVITSGKISEAELNERVLKILKTKEWAFKQQTNYKKVDPKTYLTRPEAYELQTKAYRNAITLAKKSSSIPFNPGTIKNSCIIQIGTMPENIFAKRCKQHNNKVINCSAGMSQEELETCLRIAKNPETVVIGIGEMNKFAQKKYGIADNTCALIEQLKKMNKKVIVVVFGTPYSIKKFGDADSLIVAYEDAIPAQDAAVDVLRGSLQAQGRLPITLF